MVPSGSWLVRERTAATALGRWEVVIRPHPALCSTHGSLSPGMCPLFLGPIRPDGLGAYPCTCLHSFRLNAGAVRTLRGRWTLRAQGMTTCFLTMNWTTSTQGPAPAVSNPQVSLPVPASSSSPGAFKAACVSLVPVWRSRPQEGGGQSILLGGGGLGEPSESRTLVPVSGCAAWACPQCCGSCPPARWRHPRSNSVFQPCANYIGRAVGSQSSAGMTF